MAWSWHMKSAGTLKGKNSDYSATISLHGVSGNATTKTPAQTVAIANQFLAIGDIQMVVNKDFTYTLGNEVSEDE